MDLQGSNRQVFVVVGDGLAAGVGPSGLTEHGLQWSYPAIAARSLGLAFRQPKLPMSSHGVGHLQGFEAPPPDPVPVLELDPQPIHHIAFPGMGFHEALTWQTTKPLVVDDPHRTLFHLTLGLSPLFRGRRLLTPVEAAAALQPSLALVALGYHEAVSAALERDPERLPTTTRLRKALKRICAILGDSRRILATVPDPLDTAYFSDPQTAADLLGIAPGDLQRHLPLDAGDALTLPGLLAIGHRIRGGHPEEPMDQRFRLGARTKDALRHGLERVNGVIHAVAAEDGAAVLDLHELFHHTAAHGRRPHGETLSSSFLGGFYCLNGLFPGPVGHGVLASALLELMGKPAELDWQELSDHDPGTRSARARGEPMPEAVPWQWPRTMEPDPSILRPSAPFAVPEESEHTFEPAPGTAFLGLTLEAADANPLFGGPAIARRPLQGRLRVLLRNHGKRPGIELCFDDITVGAGNLSAPLYAHYFLPPASMEGRIRGQLDPTTGMCGELTVELAHDCPFLRDLMALNPDADQTHSQEGHLRCHRAGDGFGLVLTAHTLLEMEHSEDLRLPLALGPADTLPASISANHIRLRLELTVSLGPSGLVSPEPTTIPELPERAVVELMSFGHDCRAHLETGSSLELKSASQSLIGRLLLQTGTRHDNLLPVLLGFHSLDGQGPGWLGFPTEIRSPTDVYPQPAMDLSPAKAHGACVDLETGAILGLHGFRFADTRKLLRDLQRVEPKIAFEGVEYAGSARLEGGPGGKLYLHFRQESAQGTGLQSTRGTCLPLPKGYHFPAPHGRSGLALPQAAAAVLSLRLSVAKGPASPDGTLSGEERLLSSTRQLFSYRYMLSTRPSDPAIFELTNHTEGGTFVLEHVHQVIFGGSPGSRARRNPGHGHPYRLRNLEPRPRRRAGPPAHCAFVQIPQLSLHRRLHRRRSYPVSQHPAALQDSFLRTAKRDGASSTVPRAVVQATVDLAIETQPMMSRLRLSKRAGRLTLTSASSLCTEMLNERQSLVMRTCSWLLSTSTKTEPAGMLSSSSAMVIKPQWNGSSSRRTSASSSSGMSLGAAKIARSKSRAGTGIQRLTPSFSCTLTVTVPVAATVAPKTKIGMKRTKRAMATKRVNRRFFGRGASTR